MKKLMKALNSFFGKIWHLIDKKIIVPITKLILKFTGNFDRSEKRFENWLSRPTTLLFISLFLAIMIFIIVDQKILIFSESSAEVLKQQPVTAKYNEEAYVIEGLPETVDITLIGSKTDLFIAKQSPSYDVTVDLTGLKPGTHKVNIKYNQVTSTSLEYNVNPSTVTIYIYPKISRTKTLSIDLLNKDSLDSKLVVTDMSVTNDKVIVKGAEHQLNKVATVKALADVKNILKQEAGKTTLKDVPLKAYDENGNIIDVEIVPSKIDVDLTIASPMKEVPIRIVPKGTVAFGKSISTIESSENTVVVYGDESVVSELKYITVEVDVSELKENKQYKLGITKPVGITSMSVNNITVNIRLDDSSDKDVNDVKIEYRNLAEGYTVQGLSESDIKVSVNIKGVKSVLDSITPEDITAYLDLSGYTEGTYEVEVNVEGSDTRVQYTAKTRKVRINIEKAS
ncbi:MAG: hypothetical protein HFH31_00895 [Bacilli bacterium]|nr:hypothetical protein [Bacilli bacterium]